MIVNYTNTVNFPNIYIKYNIFKCLLQMITFQRICCFLPSNIVNRNITRIPCKGFRWSKKKRKFLRWLVKSSNLVKKETFLSCFVTIWVEVKKVSQMTCQALCEVKRGTFLRLFVKVKRRTFLLCFMSIKKDKRNIPHLKYPYSAIKSHLIRLIWLVKVNILQYWV